MKKITYGLVLVALVLSFASCKKDDSTATPIKYSGLGKNLSGNLKGTLKQDSTYNLVNYATVPFGDTLIIEPGVTLKAINTPQLENVCLYVFGTLICVGTDANPILLTTNATNPQLGTGYWGGIQGDSTTNLVMKYTHLNWCGGPDASGNTNAAIDIEGVQGKSYGANVIIENNWFFASVDDGVYVAGSIPFSIKRNVFQNMGGPDGESIKLKYGVTGDVAFNYVWSAANNGIKMLSGSSDPQTEINIFNNTFLNGGWRKIGEFTNGMLIDQNGACNVVNNILVGNHAGINITTAADTVYCIEGYNLVCAINTADSSMMSLFPGIQATKTDITGGGSALYSTIFTHYDPSTDSKIDTWAVQTDNNIPTLATNSPAKGSGTATLLTSSKIPTYFSPSVKGATNDVVNVDMGAYTTDGKGNTHLPPSTMGSK